MTVRCGHATDVGRVREHNEDAYFVDEAQRVFLVADGMGGEVGGEVASRLAIDTAREVLEAAQGDWLAALREASRAANRAILQEIAARPELQGMGTTFLGIVLDRGSYYLAHVGDSRAYRLRHGGIEQLTQDHSWVQLLVEAGQMTPEQAQNSPMRSRLTRALGREGEVADVGSGVWHGDEALLLCSDGLSDVVPEEEIARLVYAHAANPQEACEALIAAANQAGGPDNITVVLITGERFSSETPAQFSDEEETRPQPLVRVDLADDLPSSATTIPVTTPNPTTSIVLGTRDEGRGARGQKASFSWLNGFVKGFLFALTLALIAGAFWGVTRLSGQYFVAWGEEGQEPGIYRGTPRWSWGKVADLPPAVESLAAELRPLLAGCSFASLTEVQQALRQAQIEVHERRAQEALQREDYPTVRREGEALWQLKPRPIEAYLLLARYWYHEGNQVQAQEYLQRAAALQPADPRVQKLRQELTPSPAPEATSSSPTLR